MPKILVTLLLSSSLFLVFGQQQSETVLNGVGFATTSPSIYKDWKVIWTDSEYTLWADIEAEKYELHYPNGRTSNIEVSAGRFVSFEIGALGNKIAMSSSFVNLKAGLVFSTVQQVGSSAYGAYFFKDGITTKIANVGDQITFTSIMHGPTTVGSLLDISIPYTDDGKEFILYLNPYNATTKHAYAGLYRYVGGKFTQILSTPFSSIRSIYRLGSRYCFVQNAPNGLDYAREGLKGSGYTISCFDPVTNRLTRIFYAGGGVENKIGDVLGGINISAAATGIRAFHLPNRMQFSLGTRDPEYQEVFAEIDEVNNKLIPIYKVGSPAGLNSTISSDGTCTIVSRLKLKQDFTGYHRNLSFWNGSLMIDFLSHGDLLADGSVIELDPRAVFIKNCTANVYNKVDLVSISFLRLKEVPTTMTPGKEVVLKGDFSRSNPISADVVVGGKITPAHLSEDMQSVVFLAPPSNGNSDQNLQVILRYRGGLLVPSDIVSIKVDTTSLPPVPRLSAVTSVFGVLDVNVGSPGQLSSIYGTAMCQDFPIPFSLAPIPLPTSLNGCQVAIDGSPVPIQYASPSQINFLLPYSIAFGRHTLTVRRYGVFGQTTVSGPILTESPPIDIAINRSSPSFVMISDLEIALVKTDGSTVSKSNPVSEREALTVFLTGLGPKNGIVPEGAILARPTSTEVRVFVNGSETRVSYAGGSGFYPGVDQINFEVPPIAPDPSGKADIRFIVDGVQFTFSIHMK